MWKSSEEPNCQTTGKNYTTNKLKWYKKHRHLENDPMHNLTKCHDPLKRSDKQINKVVINTPYGNTNGTKNIRCLEHDPMNKSTLF